MSKVVQTMERKTAKIQVCGVRTPLDPMELERFSKEWKSVQGRHNAGEPDQ
jgi:hypothetical protein